MALEVIATFMFFIAVNLFGTGALLFVEPFGGNTRSEKYHNGGFFCGMQVLKNEQMLPRCS